MSGSLQGVKRTIVSIGLKNRIGVRVAIPAKPKRPSNSKLTDADRHERFKDMAKEVEASERPEDFERAFEKITSQTPRRPERG